MKRRLLGLFAAVSSLFSQGHRQPAHGARNQFTDVRELLDAVADHTRRTGHVVVPCDLPSSGLLGYAAVGPSGATVFSITASDFGKSLASWCDQDPRFAGTICSMLGTQSGRLKVALSFPGQRQPTV